MYLCVAAMRGQEMAVRPGRDPAPVGESADDIFSKCNCIYAVLLASVTALFLASVTVFMHCF